MIEREQRYFTRESRRHWQPPQVPEGETTSGILGILPSSPSDSIESVEVVVEKDKGRADSLSPSSRAEKKFDTMMDMMSRLLAKIDQNTPHQREQPVNQGETSGSTVHQDRHIDHDEGYARRSSGSVLRPLQPTFTRRDDTSPPPTQETHMSLTEETRLYHTEYMTLPPDIRDMLTLEQFLNQKRRL